MNRIFLHPEHGVNPALDCCFWCGEATGVALLGRNNGDKAPHKVISSYEPCDACQAKFDSGVVLVEVTPHTNKTGLPWDKHGNVPTGRYMVVTPESMARMITDETLRARVLEHRKGMVPPELFERMLKDAIWSGAQIE